MGNDIQLRGASLGVHDVGSSNARPLIYQQETTQRSSFICSISIYHFDDVSFSSRNLHGQQICFIVLVSSLFRSRALHLDTSKDVSLCVMMHRHQQQASTILRTSSCAVREPQEAIPRELRACSCSGYPFVWKHAGLQI